MFKRLSAFLAVTLWLPALSSHAAIPEKPYFIGVDYGIASLYIGSKYHDHITVTSEPAKNYRERVSKPSATGFNAGFQFSDHWSIEARYMISGILNAPFFVGNDDLFNLGDLRGQAYGFYGVYQAGSKLYVRARLGVGQSFLSVSGKNVKANFSGFGISYGLTIGQSLGKLGAMEVSYMRYANIKASKSDSCILIKKLDDATETCVADGTNKSYIKFNEKMRMGAITIGYVFKF